MNSRHEPTEADHMRLRLAEARLQEMRQMDLGDAQSATLILTIDRLANALEDMIKMVRDSHPTGD